MTNVLSSRINSSPTVKGLALARGLATKNKVCRSDTFNEVVAFNNCFGSLFFLLKNSKGLSSNAGCLVSMWQSSFEGSMALLDSQLPVLYNTVLECEPPDMINT
ncbi:unnamed protein product [Rangifer tarandus platyrhynchus]|uniref:Uncharacterized protein n=2 Tax=Rangifer tarandus platyrhynchus TaxID=3082113 RepID=A0AC59ZH17_RANTA|nr:unnamed protein product [Rangifer tarandus platyrhynchus]